jgi:uncharacterized protein with von Willebrand factor type A (vWA) domain
MSGSRFGPRRTHRYSRWDGSQSEFSLDGDAALDAVSELMMEGMDAREALAWMQRYGFELAGLDMPVMGQEELVERLREEAEELYRRYRMDRATDDLRRRLDGALDREEAALRERHGFESSRLNEFLSRRHEPAERLSEHIERFRDHDFEDAQAEEEIRELLEELDRLRQLEDFLARRGPRFQGPEAAGYETAQRVREQIESLEQLARDIAEGNFQEVSPEELRELLGDPAARSFVLIRDLEPSLRRAGYLREEGPELTPRAIRRIGAQALADVYSALRKGLAGAHETHRSSGVAVPRPDETRPWAFGEPLNLHISRTLLNAVRRRRGASVPLRLAVEDFEVQEMDASTQTTTVLLLDMSWSMSWAGRFPAAKRVALALDQLVRTRFPRDHFAVVGFSTRARELPIRELPEVSWDIGDPFTNLQEGLMLAERVIRRFPSASPQILVITDGQPTAYFQGRQLRVEWPMGFGGVSPHAVAETLGQVRRVTQSGVTINTFMLDDAPELVGFVERMTQINRGRAFYTSPGQLGSFLMVDYLSHRKLRRGG